MRTARVQFCTEVDWNDLQYFLALARTGALSGAARELGVEHTTVGRRLAALETALGARLFTRGPSGLALTEAGNAILQNAQTVADRVAAIKLQVGGVDSRMQGVVRLTIPESVDGYFVQMARELRSQHPGIVLDLVSDNDPLEIRSGEADLAVRFCDVDDPDLVVRTLGRGGWALYASLDYVARKGVPSDINDLAGHEVVAYDDRAADVIGARWLRAHTAPGTCALRANGTATVANAAVAGLGIAPLPCMIGDREARLVRMSSEVLDTCTITLAVHPDLTQVARMRRTIDFLVGAFERDAQLWSGVGNDAKPDA